MLRAAAIVVAAAVSLGWSAQTTRHVAWTAVGFFPPDLERQVRRHHRRFDLGIQRGLDAPPAWRAGNPGRLDQALRAQLEACASGLRRPIPLEDLVEELGVLATLALDANDPLAVAHSDPREPSYASEYGRYVTSILPRVRLVYYGLDRGLVERGDVGSALEQALDRSRELYPFLGAEFFRTGSLRSAGSFDDRSIAFGVAGVALSHGMTDLANLAAFVWRGGGGLVPTPQPTPSGHVGPTVILAPLGGGFPDRGAGDRGRPAMPQSPIALPPP